jgi:cyclohexyl-isocyanide hydratase
MSNSILQIGLVFFPGMTQLDITGPFEIFARLPSARVHLLWKRIEPVTSDVGLTLMPTTTFADCPDLDVLCIGGGPGQVDFIEDEELLRFLRDKGRSAGYVTSVCAGALMLGAAGLLEGYKSACHWLMRDQLTAFGAIPVAERIVVDRNRISGGGVTAGIDFGFTVAAALCGEDLAKRLQLFLEYQPEPPFDITIENAPAALIADIRAKAAPGLAAREAAGQRAAAKCRSWDAVPA